MTVTSRHTVLLLATSAVQTMPTQLLAVMKQKQLRADTINIKLKTQTGQITACLSLTSEQKTARLSRGLV